MWWVSDVYALGVFVLILAATSENVFSKRSSLTLFGFRLLVALLWPLFLSYAILTREKQR